MALMQKIIFCGVTTASGQMWRTQRNLVLRFMRNFSIGKAGFEGSISQEVLALIRELKKFREKPVKTAHLFHSAISNIICLVVYGTRYDYDDPKFKERLKLINRTFELLGSGSIFFMPFTDLVAGIIPSLWELTPKLYKIHQLCQGSPPLASGRLRSPERPNRFPLPVREIDAIVGRDHLPQMSDKPHLHFTEATILEVQRISNVVPLGVPHQAREDATVMGYTIPRGTILLPNFWALGHDPKVWPEPHLFKPEGFLDKDGQVTKKDEFTQFSVGRRMCLGEPFAKMELFLFFSGLLHQFTFQRPQGAPPISFKSRAGFTLTPISFEVCAIVRAQRGDSAFNRLFTDSEVHLLDQLIPGLKLIFKRLTYSVVVKTS
ncbi:cytochrome P450 2B2-like [Acanthaster planci]|uniref:Cytochrome P450 2B2-like n=1 Tax=Acanthaster planci TaxID=133434 RepID=A0A8B7ZXU2_ACAPL|nr:cytochrome P450 2B2-like [Acanthaster planci]